ncbi:unnamed protein product, partial [Brenthis ino]
MNPKRIRSINWDEEEKRLLRSVLRDYTKIIENKSLNTNTNKIKTKAWEEVHKKFNELNCRQRELGQLKVQWKSMNVNARKHTVHIKLKLIKWAVGAAEDHNPYDSDGLVPISSIDEVLPSGSGTCAIISLQIQNQLHIARLIIY